MKFKYFVRGLGVGILFCTLILFAAYQTSPNKLLTDEEVKTRAKQLGMVEEQSSLDKVISEDTSEDTSADDTTDTVKATENTTTEEATDTENTTTEEMTDTEDTATEKTTAIEGTVVTATVTVTTGMLSSSVAKQLERQGIIDSASDFDRYLNKQGYATKIRVGTYTVKSSDSYETLAKILMKQE